MTHVCGDWVIVPSKWRFRNRKRSCVTSSIFHFFFFFLRFFVNFAFSLIDAPAQISVLNGADYDSFDMFFMNSVNNTNERKQIPHLVHRFYGIFFSQTLHENELNYIGRSLQICFCIFLYTKINLIFSPTIRLTISWVLFLLQFSHKFKQ